MLIIFDLDDTLIDTSGCTAPIKLKEALEVMVDAGLQVNSFEDASNLLSEVDSTSPNGNETLRAFLRKIDADDSFLKIGTEEMGKPVPEDTVIRQLEGASEILSWLKHNNYLALVSKGKEELQFQKMRKAGIDKDLFSKIIITEEYNKKDKYKEVMEELSFTSKDTIVVGDKFYSDLLPAKELGIRTVQMMWGRALKFPEEGADFKINKLGELVKLLKKWKEG